MTEYLGYVCALLIGLILGISGAGGSILTVPVLVYIMGLTPVTATAYSLFVVGTTSAFGSIQNAINKITEIRTAFVFALPSLIGVYLSRRYLLPAIPEIIIDFNGFILLKGTLLMVLFGVIIFFAGLAMLKEKGEETTTESHKITAFLILKIFLTGILVGLVGAGGGFLFIPLLVYTAGLPMKKAVATSLLIIAINSLAGFTGDMQTMTIDWWFLLTFTTISIIGIFVGIYIGKYINEKQLKKGFGWFILLMSFFIFGKELFF